MAKLTGFTLDTGNELVAATTDRSHGRQQTMLWVHQIRTNGGTQMRASLNDATVTEYGDAMIEAKGWGSFKPVEVYYDGDTYWLADGFHRLAAWVVIDYEEDKQIPAIVHSGTRRDAVLHAAGANADHGLRRTNADKRRSVETLLNDDEWANWSDREIARRCKVSAPLVAQVRGEIHTVNSYSMDNAPAERTYVHPKTGAETTMRVGSIGQRPAVSVAVPLARVVGKCKVCQRQVTDPESVAQGCGPDCRKKLAAQGGPDEVRAVVADVRFVEPETPEDPNISTFEKFLTVYPDGWITISMSGATAWTADIYRDMKDFEENGPCLEAVGSSPQVALGNLAAKLLHHKK